MRLTCVLALCLLGVNSPGLALAARNAAATTDLLPRIAPNAHDSALMLANLKRLEDDSVVQTDGRFVALSGARQRSFSTPYGSILWQWRQDGSFMEETLHRRDVTFTARWTELSPRETQISDSAGGGFRLVRGRDSRHLEELRDEAGVPLVQRTFDPLTGHLIRESIADSIEVEYIYLDGLPRTWSERVIRFVGSTREIREHHAVGKGLFPRLSYFVDPSQPSKAESHFLQKTVQAPHGLPIARAGKSGGFVLASLSTFTYAAIEPGTGRVLYRRYSMPQEGHDMIGTEHEIILTSDEVWVTLGRAEHSTVRQFKLPRASAHIASVPSGRVVAPLQMIGVMCESQCSWQETSGAPYCLLIQDCLFYYDDDGGGEGAALGMEAEALAEETSPRPSRLNRKR